MKHVFFFNFDVLFLLGLFKSTYRSIYRWRTDVVARTPVLWALQKLFLFFLIYDVFSMNSFEITPSKLKKLVKPNRKVKGKPFQRVWLIRFLCFSWQKKDNVYVVIWGWFTDNGLGESKEMATFCVLLRNMGRGGTGRTWWSGLNQKIAFNKMERIGKVTKNKKTFWNRKEYKKLTENSRNSESLTSS